MDHTEVNPFFLGLFAKLYISVTMHSSHSIRLMTERELIKVLKEEFSVTPEQLDLAKRHAQRMQGSLHMVLWQFGLITLEQLDALIGRMTMGNRSSSSDDISFAIHAG